MRRQFFGRAWPVHRWQRRRVRNDLDHLGRRRGHEFHEHDEYRDGRQSVRGVCTPGSEWLERPRVADLR